MLRTTILAIALAAAASQAQAQPRSSEPDPNRSLFDRNSDRLQQHYPEARGVPRGPNAQGYIPGRESNESQGRQLERLNREENSTYRPATRSAR